MNDGYLVVIAGLGMVAVAALIGETIAVVREWYLRRRLRRALKRWAKGR